MGAGAQLARASATRASIALASLAPAIVWFLPPASPLLAVLAVALALAVALHGLGRALGRLAGDDDAPWPLAIAWGLAGYLALGGWLSAAGWFALDVQRAVLVLATVAGAAWAASRAWPPVRRPRPRLAWLAPALAVVAVVVHLIGAAGTWHGGFTDGEGHLLGPLGRLATTGALDDPFALPRTTGLGGNAILHTLAAGLGDWRMSHAIDRGLALALVVALAFTGIRRGPARILALFAVVGLASGVPEYAADLAPRWTLVALGFALHQSLARRTGPTPRAALPALLIAAGLASLRHGGLGALAVIAAVVVLDTARGRRGRALGLVALVTVAVLGGYLLSAVAAASGEPASPDVLAILARGAPLRLALWGAFALVAHAAAGLVVRGHGDRALEAALAALCAAIALSGPLAPAAAVWLTVQPLGIGLVLLVIAPALAAASERPLARLGAAPAAAVAVVGLALAFATLRFPLGRPPLSWEDRLGRLVEAGRALAGAEPGTDNLEGLAYAEVLRPLPPGARIGLWVDRGDLVDYRGRQLVDLRSAATSACARAVPRTTRWFKRSLASCRQLEALLPRLDLDYLVISAAALPRPDAWAERPWCYLYTPSDCVDPITRLVGAERRRGAGALNVVELRPTSRP